MSSLKKNDISTGGSYEAGMDGRMHDFIEGSKKYVWKDVVEPGIRSMLLKAGHGLVDILFDNKNGRRNYSSNYTYGRSYDYEGEPSYYNNYTKPNNKHNGSGNAYIGNPRSRTKYTKVIFNGGWSKAKEAQEKLENLFDQKHVVTVENLIVMCKRDYNIDMPSDFTDCEWGWLDITTISVHSRSDGRAVLILPPPEYIK